jgi:hypothetical protein
MTSIRQTFQQRAELRLCNEARFVNQSPSLHSQYSSTLSNLAVQSCTKAKLSCRPRIEKRKHPLEYKKT